MSFHRATLALRQASTMPFCVNTRIQPPTRFVRRRSLRAGEDHKSKLGFGMEFLVLQTNREENDLFSMYPFCFRSSRFYTLHAHIVDWRIDSPCDKP